MVPPALLTGQMKPGDRGIDISAQRAAARRKSTERQQKVELAGTARAKGEALLPPGKSGDPEAVFASNMLGKMSDESLNAADHHGFVSKFVAGGEPGGAHQAGPAQAPPAAFEVDSSFGKYNAMSKQGQGPRACQVRERTGQSDSSSNRKHQYPHGQDQGMMVSDEQVQALRAAHAANTAALGQHAPITIDSDSSPEYKRSSKKRRLQHHDQPVQQPAACSALAPLPVSPFLTHRWCCSTPVRHRQCLQ